MSAIILLSGQPSNLSYYELVKNVTNCTTKHCNISDDVQRHPFAEQIAVLFLYVITCVVALVGNYSVCKVIYKSKKLKTTTYILIANLAVTDIIGAIAIPTQWFFCSTWFMDEFSYGERMCGIIKSIQVQSYYGSTFTMAVIAIDRHRMIVSPMKPRIKPKISIVITWLLAGAFTATTSVSMRVSEYFTKDALIYCRIVFRQENEYFNFIYRQVRITISILLQFVFPLTICAVFYVRAVMTIWRQNVDELTEGQPHALHLRNHFKWRTTKMLIIVVIAFTLSWLPVHTIHVYDFFIEPMKPTNCNTTMRYALAYWLGMLRISDYIIIN